MKHPRTGRIVSAGPNKVFLDSLSDGSGWSILWILSGITVTSAPVSFAQSQFHRETHNLLFQPTVLEDLQTAPQWPLFEHLWQVTSFAGQFF